MIRAESTMIGLTAAFNAVGQVGIEPTTKGL